MTMISSTMRFPHRLSRSYSLIRRRAHSINYASQGNASMARGAVAGHLAIGQTHTVSTFSSSSSRHDCNNDCNNCIQVAGLGNSYGVGGGLPSLFSNSLRVDGYNDAGRLLKIMGVRAFSSTSSTDNTYVDEDDVDSDTAAAGAIDEMNQRITSLADSGDTSKAEELLNQMQANAIAQSNIDGLPDVDTYTSLMDALIDQQNILISPIDHNNNHDDGPNGEKVVEKDDGETHTITTLAEKTHHLLIQMEDLSGVSDHYSSMRLSATNTQPTDLRNASLRPTSHHYDSVISAFANATTYSSSPSVENAPFIAQRWLQRMETLAFDPHSGVRPTVDSYFHVMEACAAAAAIPDDNNNKQCKAATLTQSIFDKLSANTNIYPTAREYRLMIRTWCVSPGGRQKEAAYKAMGFWMIMAREFRVGGATEMEPMLEDGKMVLEAWTRAINKHTARRAQTVLSTMEKLHASKKTTVKPDLECYRHVLLAMSRSRVPTVGHNIPRLLKSMEDNQLSPDTFCFDAAIETLKNCARHSKSDDAEKYARAAEGMLLRMELQRERDSESVIEPSAVTYTNVIQALAARKTAKAALRAEELLTKMEEEYAGDEEDEGKGGNELMRPTRDSYVGVIHAHGNSDAEDKYIRANDVLQRMIAQHAEGNEEARPDVCSFHAVIRACSRTVEATSSPEKHREALLLAISTVQHMKKSESTRPNAKSYLLLLQCCANLLPSGSVECEKALSSIFRSCRKDGLVNRQVLKQFQSTVSTEAYHREVVRDAPTFDGIKSLPETWTRSLGYRPRTHSGTDGDGMVTEKRNPIISVGGEVIGSTAYNDHRMRRRWEKKNQKVLQGGRS